MHFFLFSNGPRFYFLCSSVLSSTFFYCLCFLSLLVSWTSTCVSMTSESSIRPSHFDNDNMYRHSTFSVNSKSKAENGNFLGRAEYKIRNSLTKDSEIWRDNEGYGNLDNSPSVPEKQYSNSKLSRHINSSDQKTDGLRHLYLRAGSSQPTKDSVIEGHVVLDATNNSSESTMSMINNRGPSYSNTVSDQSNNVGSPSLHIKSNTSIAVVSLNEILYKSWKRALGGGIPGALAGVIQVLTLMWLRTTMNYQYRYGTSTFLAMKVLYKQGGISRFYHGIGFALIQGPLSRFGSTAANDGIVMLLNTLPYTKLLPLSVTTAVASVGAGAWRMLLMPIDTCKTVLQVEGREGFKLLRSKVVKEGQLSLLYQGAVATALSTMAGHYPWFLTYNLLQNYFTALNQDEIVESKNELTLSKESYSETGATENLQKSNFYLIALLNKYPRLKDAFIGFIASVISDSMSNFLRVIKTTKQSSTTVNSAISYKEAIQIVFAADGLKGLFGRGLSTRILANGIQSMLFTVIWGALKAKYN